MRANMYYMRAIMNRNPHAVHILRRLTGNYGIMKKKAQMRREILRGSDTYVSN